MLRKTFSASRYLVIIAVLSLFVAATILLVYAAINTVEVSVSAFAHGVSSTGAKELALEFIELTDLFLVAIVLYIIAMGLYELFIDKDVPTPDWLHITDLDDLKKKLIGVLVVVMAVLFVEHLYAANGEAGILYSGAAIAVVITALTWFLGKH